MSDFDKEAEREKLREKYERDKAEREATQRMSDLLLKGATMTNMHCGTCGDPLFKQDGTTFCPSCHGNPDAVEGTDLEAQPVESDEDAASADEHGAAAGQADADDWADAASRPTDGERDSTATVDRESTGETIDSSDRVDAADARDDDRDARSARRDEQTEATAPSSSTSSASSEPTRDPSGRSRRPRQSRDDRRSEPDHRGRDRTSAPRSAGGNADLETARASLVRALEKWADEAAAADDPRYARECLEAAREASETLTVLR